MQDRKPSLPAGDDDEPVASSSGPDSPNTEQPAQNVRAARPTLGQDVETLSGRFVWISLWRAFRLQIKAREILTSERRILARDAPHVTDPEHMAFLAWRRSVLLLVALAFIPLTVLRLIEAIDSPLPTGGKVVQALPAVAEALFCVIAFDQLKHWTRWKKQRRVLFIAWAIFMLAPFVVYLYPFRETLDGTIRAAREAAELGNVRLAVKRDTVQLVAGLAFGVQAQLVLAPKVIALMPGLIRASIVSKLLFPGMTAPGWLILLSAPLYALFAYIIALLPYQITGHWFFVAGNLGILTAQIFISISGRILTEPLEADTAHRRIHKSWLAYIVMMSISAGFMVLGLYDFISQLNLGLIRIFSSTLSFLANVLLLTLIGTDLIVGGMAYYRRRVVPNEERERLFRQSEAKLDRFSL